MKKIDYEYALAITSQFFFCGIPFRLDTTPKCELNCLYCFAMSRGGRKTNTNMCVNLSKFKNKLSRAFDNNGQEYDINTELLRNRMPIHFGGMSDPFSDPDTSLLSDQILAALTEYQYPVVISTKNSDALCEPERIDLIKKNRNVVVQISIPFFQQSLANTLEPNCPSPVKRLNSLSILNDNNIATSVRIQPLIPGSEMEVSESLVPAIAKTGCEHVITEYLKIAIEKQISKQNDFFNAINRDLYSYYRDQGASVVGREWILPKEYRWENLQPIVKAIQISGMTWGAADYGLTHLGDTQCCCGLDKFVGFENWFTPNFSNLIRKADIGELLYKPNYSIFNPSKSIKRYLNSDCRIDGNQSIKSYLLSKWNRPGTVNAPDTFLGVSFDGTFDPDGNAIYHKQLVRRKG